MFQLNVHMLFVILFCVRQTTVTLFKSNNLDDIKQQQDRVYAKLFFHFLFIKIVKLIFPLGISMHANLASSYVLDRIKVF